MVDVYGGARIRQTRLPVFRQGLAQLGDLVDVTGQRQGNDVGAQAVDHATGLLARTTMGLLDGHGVVRMGLFPVLGELGVVFLIQLTCRVVRHVEQLVILGDSGTCEYSAGESGQGKTANGHR